ncbi:MAG: hypothetical protein WAV38_14710 [Xanthobacteraceae bacterium]
MINERVAAGDGKTMPAKSSRTALSKDEARRIAANMAKLPG